jgi:CHC2 zinc finger
MTDFSSDIFQVVRDGVDFASLIEAETRSKMDRGRGFCPLHTQQSGNPAFILDPDGYGHCFSCGFHGDVVNFWSQFKGLDSQFEAARDLARQEGVSLPEEDPEAIRRASERRQREETALGIAELSHGRLEETDTPQARRVREYLAGRGFDKELCQRFLLGVTKDGSVSIPFWNGGRVHGVVRRTFGDGAKYLAPKTEEMPLGRKPLMMKDPLRDEVVFLVEGFLDHLALSASGVPSVGIGCATPSASQIKDLRNLIRRGHEIVVVPDNDKNGRGIEAARKTVEKQYPGARMAGFLPEPHKDAADLFESASREEVRETLWDLAEEARDAVGLALEDLAEDDLRRVRHIKSRILPLILRLPDSEREAVLRGVGKAAGLPLDVMRQAMVEVQVQEPGESGETEEEIPESEWADLLDGGVLGRYASDAARTRGVVGDRGVLKLLTLSAISSQLSRRLDNRPTGVSLMLSGEASRGKNFLTDAATSLLPDEWVVAFEVASSQAFYYAVEDDPEFLKHKFLYSNEAEAVDQVVEFLRPMLSKGSAKKLVTNKDKSGRNTWKEFEVEGPITGVIPTVRNKLDDQLQTRLLMVGLEEVEDRIRLHTRSVSKAYSPDWIDEFDETLRSRWCSALRSLQGVRLVAIPFGDDDRFCVTNEGLSHGYVETDHYSPLGSSAGHRPGGL